MKKKKIILSYDYELFFGDRSGTVQKSLIDPTNQLLDAMDSAGFKGNFFIDWQMIKYLKEANTERTTSDYNKIVNQLKDMVRRGHRIELHIHPHWVDAKYNGDGTWDFSEFNHYSLNSFTEEEVTDMFIEGTNLLESIAREVFPDYKIIAFRAGGWAIQPFSKLKKGFLKAGIKIDSSVAKGSYGENKYSYYDFRKLEVNTDYQYRFSSDITKEDLKGVFIEVPISSYHRLFINKVSDKLFRIFFKSSKIISDGTHERQDLNGHNKTGEARVTLSRISPISSIFSILLHRSPIVTVIDHPKDYTHSASYVIKFISRFYQTILYKDLCYEQ